MKHISNFCTVNTNFESEESSDQKTVFMPYVPPTITSSNCYYSSYNTKRLLCYSILIGEKCTYGPKCTYAHSYEEQVIDLEKENIYKIILDEKLMNFFSMSDPMTDVKYKSLIRLANLCENCLNNMCTGGYNCRNGSFDKSIKLCKNDLLSGTCHNKQIDINVPESFLSKFTDCNICKSYIGCYNGHHLTSRGLLPYCKYVHEKEKNITNQYSSTRYIDMSPYFHVTEGHYQIDKDNILQYDDMCSESDEEFDKLFSNNERF